MTLRHRVFPVLLFLGAVLLLHKKNNISITQMFYLYLRPPETAHRTPEKASGQCGVRRTLALPLSFASGTTLALPARASVMAGSARECWDNVSRADVSRSVRRSRRIIICLENLHFDCARLNSSLRSTRIRYHCTTSKNVASTVIPQRKRGSASLTAIRTV